MKLAISASGPGLDAEVDPRFGRAPWFVFFDPENGTVDSAENAGCDAPEGAGIHTAQFVMDHGADVVLTGRCGPNAEAALDAGSVAIVTDVHGTVGEAVKAYREGRREAAQGVAARSGRPGGLGRGAGRGQGRGGGGGRGRGGGAGRGRGQGRGGGGGRGQSRGQGRGRGQGRV
jgi:predicted Fe-Mo cluster-binding NifX family protein